MEDKRNVVLVDDHPVIIAALKLLLEKEDFNIVACADNGVDAIRLIKEHKPDAVVLDIGIPKLDGFKVINRVKALISPPEILVMTAQHSEYFVTRSIESGASGFVSKTRGITEVISALRAILSGYAYFPRNSGNQSGQSLLLAEADRLASLSDRELIVLQNLASGLSNKEIANSLLLSSKTISGYKARLMEKLDARNLVDLIEISKRNNIV